MVVLRHLVDSEPDVQSATGDADPDVPTMVHFDARQPRAATQVEQESRSVVIRDPGGSPAQYDPSDVTETIRPRAASRSVLAKSIAWAEGHWVLLAIAVTVPLTVVLGWSLFR